ncbi:MAG TPA: L-2-hydroxyglutarate oxidase [Gaiellaceae bacterium]|nr:L-2-hydroxyglutarate oxidase [Gaiellaceae bacterium]
MAASGERVDAVVIGGGIVGLATAAEIAARRPAWDVVVLEKERELAAHQTGRNSGVIHSGIYYTPGSLKARLCTEGRRLLVAFCEEEGVPYELCGKVVVATEAGELPALEELERRAAANGVEAERIGQARLRELEPACAGVAALHVPETGLVDYRRVAVALADRLARTGGGVDLATRALSLHEEPEHVRVVTERRDYLARKVIACAGVHADALAGDRGRDTRVVPFRGAYFALRPEARHLCRNLIYPVPDARFPFLGVHVNRRPDDEVWAGPNAVVALALEGYRRRDVHLGEAWRTLSYPGFLRLARRYWRLGSVEAWRDVSRRAYAAQARRYLPGLRAEDLSPAPAGVRAQALARDGTLLDDFLFAGAGRVLHVRNAPSPAATSALAIARLVADRAFAEA